MERKKYLRNFLITALFSLGLLVVAAQNPNSEKIYNAYISGNMDEWASVITEMENQATLSTYDKEELLSYYYGYMGYLMGKGNKKLAKDYVAKGDAIISDLLEQTPDNPTILAYKGSFIGYKMGLNKLKAVVLGPESMKYIQKAYEMDPENIQVIADNANMLYYAPSVFGGNKKEAIRLYNKAIDLLEKRNATRQNWFYLNLLTTLGQHYESFKQYDKAMDVYEKTLQFEPDYKWVRDELYPGVKNRSK